MMISFKVIMAVLTLCAGTLHAVLLAMVLVASNRFKQANQISKKVLRKSRYTAMFYLFYAICMFAFCVLYIVNKFEGGTVKMLLVFTAVVFAVEFTGEVLFKALFTLKEVVALYISSKTIIEEE